MIAFRSFFSAVIFSVTDAIRYAYLDNIKKYFENTFPQERYLWAYMQTVNNFETTIRIFFYIDYFIK